MLIHLKEIVAEVIEQNLDKTDFWDALTSEQQAELDKALQESKKPFTQRINGFVALV